MCYTAQDLADAFGFSAKGIRDLVTRGVLPPANGRGPGKHYSQRHFDLLKSYRKQIPVRGNRLTQADLAERLRRTGHLDPPRIYSPSP